MCSRGPGVLPKLPADVLPRHRCAPEVAPRCAPGAPVCSRSCPPMCSQVGPRCAPEWATDVLPMCPRYALFSAGVISSLPDHCRRFRTRFRPSLLRWVWRSLRRCATSMRRVGWNRSRKDWWLDASATPPGGRLRRSLNNGSIGATPDHREQISIQLLCIFSVCQATWRKSQTAFPHDSRLFSLSEPVGRHCARRAVWRRGSILSVSAVWPFDASLC